MVRWTYASKLDLKQIYNYIAKDSIYYAKKVINDIVDKSENLGTFPKMGRVVEEMNEENLREIIVYSYRLIYRIVDDGITVVAIAHSKQNLTNDMLGD